MKGENKDKLKFIKMKNLCCTNYNTKNKKNGRTFENDMSDKGLVSNLYKGLLKFNNKKRVKKWTNDLNRNFTKEHIRMARKHMKRFST